MSQESISQTGRRKNRSKPATNIAQKANNAKRDFLDRLARGRLERERQAERRRSEEAAAAVDLYRAERARAIAEGKPVAPTLDELRLRLKTRGASTAE